MEQTEMIELKNRTIALINGRLMLKKDLSREPVKDNAKKNAKKLKISKVLNFQIKINNFVR